LNFFLRNNFCYDDRKIRIRQIWKMLIAEKLN
jgi:hypothetical protein